MSRISQTVYIVNEIYATIRDITDLTLDLLYPVEGWNFFISSQDLVVY